MNRWALVVNAIPTSINTKTKQIRVIYSNMLSLRHNLIRKGGGQPSKPPPPFNPIKSQKSLPKRIVVISTY